MVYTIIILLYEYDPSQLSEVNQNLNDDKYIYIYIYIHNAVILRWLLYSYMDCKFYRCIVVALMVIDSTTGRINVCDHRASTRFAARDPARRVCAARFVSGWTPTELEVEVRGRGANSNVRSSVHQI